MFVSYVVWGGCSFLGYHFFFSSRRRQTRCALVTGVQTCALPICVRALTRLASGASLAVLAVAPAWAQDAAGESVASEDEIVVTGFRASLDKARDQKRDSIAAVGGIVAEDRAKFPDQKIGKG